MRSRVRFITAISVALLLGGWLLYASLGGALETYAGPGEVQSGSTYRLNALVASGAPADAPERAQSAEGLRFSVLDKEDGKPLEVIYRGNVPDAFKDGREIVITGELKNGVFEAQRNSMVTLCPSKFSDNPSDHEPLVDIPDVNGT